MSNTVEIRVPDVGDFNDIPVIEVLVAAGDVVEAEQSLITLESDKATMEVPAPAAGKIISLELAVDDTVNEGDLIATLEVGEAADADAAPAPEAEPAKRAADAADAAPAETAESEPPSPEPAPEPAAPEPAAPAPAPAGESAEYDYDVVVLGSGPGGYTAAFRAADLGLRHSTGRALSYSWWCLSERGLHSFESPACTLPR